MQKLHLLTEPNLYTIIFQSRKPEATDKIHKKVMRDIRFLLDKGAIDLILSHPPNLGDDNDEPICIESSYLSENGQSYPEYLLNEYAANVLASSYDPVIARKLIKLIKELKKASAAIDTPETLMARALLMAKETMDNQRRQFETKNQQLALQEKELKEQVPKTEPNQPNS